MYKMIFSLLTSWLLKPKCLYSRQLLQMIQVSTADREYEDSGFVYMYSLHPWLAWKLSTADAKMQSHDYKDKVEVEAMEQVEAEKQLGCMSPDPCSRLNDQSAI